MQRNPRPSPHLRRSKVYFYSYIKNGQGVSLRGFHLRLGGEGEGDGDALDLDDATDDAGLAWDFSWRVDADVPCRAVGDGEGDAVFLLLLLPLAAPPFFEEKLRCLVFGTSSSGAGSPASSRRLRSSASSSLARFIRFARRISFITSGGSGLSVRYMSGGISLFRTPCEV